MTKTAEKPYPLGPSPYKGVTAPAGLQIGSNMAAANQQKHLSLSFATEAYIHLSKN